MKRFRSQYLVPYDVWPHEADVFGIHRTSQLRSSFGEPRRLGLRLVALVHHSALPYLSHRCRARTARRSCGRFQQMGLPVGARKRLLVEIHGYPSPRMEAFGMPPSPLASPPPFPSPEAQEHAAATVLSPGQAGSAGSALPRPSFSPKGGGAGSMPPPPSRPLAAEAEAVDVEADLGAAPMRGLHRRQVSTSSLLARVRAAGPGPRPSPPSLSPSGHPIRAARHSGGVGVSDSGDGDGVGGGALGAEGAAEPNTGAGGGVLRALDSKNPSPRRGTSPLMARARAGFGSQGMGGNAESMVDARRRRHVSARAAAAAAATAMSSAEATAAAALAAEAAMKDMQQRKGSSIPRAASAPGSRLVAPSRLRRPGSSSTAHASGGGGHRELVHAGSSDIRGVGGLRVSAPDDDGAGSTMMGSSRGSAASGPVGSTKRSFIPRPSPRSARTGARRAGEGRV